MADGTNYEEQRDARWRAEGALAEVQRQLRDAEARLETERRAHRETRGTLGDLQDAVDALTTCRTLDDMRVAVDELCKAFPEKAPERLNLDEPGIDGGELPR